MKARMMKMNSKYEEAIGEFNDIIKSDADPDVKRKAQLELSGPTSRSKVLKQND